MSIEHNSLFRLTFGSKFDAAFSWISSTVLLTAIGTSDWALHPADEALENAFSWILDLEALPVFGIDATSPDDDVVVTLIICGGVDPGDVRIWCGTTFNVHRLTDVHVHFLTYSTKKLSAFYAAYSYIFIFFFIAHCGYRSIWETIGLQGLHSEVLCLTSNKINDYLLIVMRIFFLNFHHFVVGLIVRILLITDRRFLWFFFEK